MALVKYGGGVIQMSGSLAGNTFARNRSGNYVRARTKPVNPNSERQQEVRSILAFLTTVWAETLSGAQRIAWNLYASNVGMKNKLGETIFLSGFNHFIRSNALLKRATRTIVEDGPVTFELPAQDPTFAITASEGSQLIEYTFDTNLAWRSEDDAYLFLFQGSPQNTQRIFFAGPWRYVGHFSGVTGAGPESPGTFAVPFPIGEGQKLWCYGRIERADGRLSEIFRAETFCTA